MIIKKYLVSTIDEVQNLINKELGPHAVILTSRHIKYKGWKAFFFRNRVEVVAAVDSKDLGEHRYLDNSSTFQSPHSFLSATSFDENLNRLKQIFNQLEVPQILEQISLNDEPSLYLYDGLRSEGVDEELVALVRSRVESRMNNHRDESPQEALSKEVAALIPESGPITLAEERPFTAAFVGPPGAGKTSALLKIALEYKATFGKKVAIITYGCHQTFPVENVSVVAETHGIPCSQAQTEAMLQHELALYQDADLILVDTIGCGLFDNELFYELETVFKDIPSLHLFLVLSADAKDADAIGIVRQFAPLNIESLIFTKLDETLQKGILLNICARTGVPVSYLVSGPALHEGLQIANPEGIAELFLPKFQSA